MSRLKVILEVLDNALSQLGESGNASPRTGYEQRQTYLLMSSCKLFCMTAQARIYLETSKLPIVPKPEKATFRDLARDSIQAYFFIYKTFNGEEDLRHLDYLTIVSRSSFFPPWPEVSPLTTVQTCWEHIRDLYLALYSGNLEWYPITEVGRQIILLESTLRVTPAGKNVSVMHSIANMENGARSPDEPNYLKEEDRLKAGL